MEGAMTNNSGKVVHEKDKALRKRGRIVKYIRVYTNGTGIHGLRYTLQEGRPIFERILWILIFCTSLYGCIILIVNAWRKWEASPVLVSFAESPTYVWEIPFPAVTICPQTKARQREFNFTDTYNKWCDGKLDDEGLNNFSASALICDHYLYTEGNRTIELEALDHIKRVAPQFNETLFQCVWALHNTPCPELFTEIITEDGLCFTFNMLSVRELLKDNMYSNTTEDDTPNSEWTLISGYPETATLNAYPRRVKGAGFIGSLVLLLVDYNQDWDYLCRAEPQGYKVILHNPEESPRVGMRYYQAPHNEELLISVLPEMMKTSEYLNSYSPHKRECFFPHEKYLKFFQRYTQRNCEIECLVNITVSKCGCAALYMPRESSTPICGPGSSQCLEEAESQLIQKEVEFGIVELGSYDKQYSSAGCNCLPACNSLEYNAEFSQSEFNWIKVGQGYREDLEKENPGVQLTRITIFFKQSQFITFERNELFGTADFLANCGGILGLLTGFSLVSLIEIIYFTSLRILCNMKMYGVRYWTGPPIKE